ncbi:MAG: hypothetical protein ACJ8AT_22185 [Hyalangium sp.]|uniref:hypothetical protein n=1 Tax=Hyalangium sp. TaxID=2028555 RepID=UPI003899AC24
MRYAILVGCVWLGASVVGCGGVRAEAPLLEENPVVASAGRGGGAEINTGPWAALVHTPKVEQERRRLYEQVSKDLGLEPRAVSAPAPWGGRGQAVGGSGSAGREQRGCAEVLAANEPAAVVSGTLEYAVDGVLSVNVPGEGPMKLRADESTCAVQAHQERGTPSLHVGTETQVAYVLKNGLPTARVVRAAPERFMR